jgi:Arc/MetJ family transcription regulator
MASAKKSKRSAVSEPIDMPAKSAGRKKTLRLDQRLLDSARRALGTRTETEAVTRALEAVVRREHQVQGLRLLAELGAVEPERIDD